MKSFLQGLVIGFSAVASTFKVGHESCDESLEACGVLKGGSKYHVRPFKVNLSSGVPRMLALANHTLLPEKPEWPGLGDTAGIDLDVLKSLKRTWLDDFDWESEQASMNEVCRFHHYLVDIEGLTIHFIHEKSSDTNAIPLILIHGWPGSFLEFTSIAKNLTQQAETSTGNSVSFDVVVPSLPGFAFSSATPANWTVDDTARVYNTLMTEVLGYKTFATHGTDWGAAPSYSLYSTFNTSTRAAHFSFIPFYPWTTEQLNAANITLSTDLERESARHDEWERTGYAYLQLHSTKPNTIGLALYDNPLGQLAWIGEKLISWSDPRAEAGPSLLTHNEMLKAVSLYYLTRTFVSSIFIYYQNFANGFKDDYTKANTDAPMLFSAFRYNVAYWPEELVARVGNLVSYKNHDFGGHFPGIDNPAALLEDIREIGTYWTG